MIETALGGASEVIEPSRDYTGLQYWGGCKSPSDSQTEQN
jgi:hypothetical protein